MKLTPLETAAVLSSKLKQNSAIGDPKGKNRPDIRNIDKANQLLYKPNSLSQQLQSAKFIDHWHENNSWNAQVPREWGFDDKRLQYRSGQAQGQLRPSGPSAGNQNMMKRLLTHATMRAPGESIGQNDREIKRAGSFKGPPLPPAAGPVQIMTTGHGFPKKSPKASNRGLLNNESEQKISPSQKQLTQAQIYNRMQQAKLLGCHSDKLSTKKPQVVKSKPTLANLLRYQSPRQDKRSRSPVLKQNAPGVYPYSLLPQEVKLIEKMNSPANIKMRVEHPQQIFREQNPQTLISPIQSEGSQDSQDSTDIKQKQLSYNRIGSAEQQRRQNFEILKLMASAGTHPQESYGSVVLKEDRRQQFEPPPNANILIKDCTTSQFAHLHEPYLRHLAVQQSRQTHTPTRGDTIDKEPPLIDKQILRQMRVNGVHNNAQELFFDTQDETGRTMIQVPPLPSKFHGSVKAAKKQYAICKLDDRELERVMSDATKGEIMQLKNLTKSKLEKKQEVFFEDIYTFPIELNAKQDRESRKKKNFDIGKKLQEEREQEKWKKFEQKLVQSRNFGGPLDDARHETHMDEEVAQGAGLGGSHFNYMNIDELKQHENGILNLFEGERNIGRYVSHNNEALTGLGGGHKSRKYVRLSQREYDTIFEKDPSFNEKKAFVEVFRRKWKEDKGYCSLFDKRQKYRKAKSAANLAHSRKEMAFRLTKSRQEQVMLVNYREKKAEKARLLAEQKLKEEKELEENRERESRSQQRMARRALRRTRTKTPKKREQVDNLGVPKIPIERKSSQMFSLNKTESLEYIMQGIASSKIKLVAGSIRSVSSPRAWSANALGARNRSANIKPMNNQTRLESSNIPANRDVTERQKLNASGMNRNSGADQISDGTPTPNNDMQLKGKQAYMHQPLQNHDNDYLSNFITQMYQTTTTQNKPQRPAQIQQIDVQDQRVDHLRNSFGSQELENGIHVSERINLGAEGTYVDSVVRYRPEEALSKTGMIQIPQGIKDTPIDNLRGARSYKKTTAEEMIKTASPDQPQNAQQVALYQQDIRIISMSKEKTGISQQISKRDFEIIQEQIERKQASSIQSRDPKQVKTQPVTQRQTLMKPDEAVNFAHNSPKTIYSHRDDKKYGINEESKKDAEMQGRYVKQSQEARLSQQVKNSVKPGQIKLMINQKKAQAVEAGDSKEINIMSSEGTIPDLSQNQLDPTHPPYYASMPPGTTSVLYQSNEREILKHRQSQQTDSKSSKLSDDVHDGSFMQPKNQRDSFDSKEAEAIVQISSEKNTSKDKLKTSKRQKSAGIPEATLSSIRARESAKAKQQRNEQSIQKQQHAGRAITTTQAELTSFGSREGEVGASRQQRITVNSSYKSKKANQLDNQRKEMFFAQASSVLDNAGQHSSKNSLPHNTVPSSSLRYRRQGSMGQAAIAKQKETVAHKPSDYQYFSNDDLLTQQDQNLYRRDGSNGSGERATSDNDEHVWKMKQVMMVNGTESQSQLDVLMKQGRPSVYNLPHNPINQKSFKCNYIKSRVETKRMNFVQSQTQKAFQLGAQQLKQQQQLRHPLENSAYTLHTITNEKIPVTSAFDTNTSKLNSIANNRSATSFKNPVSNSYLRNQKIVQLRKKEQQFCYYLQQHRQNKQLLESLEKQAAEHASLKPPLMMGSSQNQLSVASRPRSRKPPTHQRVASNVKRDVTKVSQTSGSGVRTPANLIISGQGALSVTGGMIRTGGGNASHKNEDINNGAIIMGLITYCQCREQQPLLDKGASFEPAESAQERSITLEF